MERRGGGGGEEEKCRTGRVGSGRNRENYATIGNILAFEKELKGESELKGAEGLDPQPPPHQPHPPPPTTTGALFIPSCQFLRILSLKTSSVFKLRYLASIFLYLKPCWPNNLSTGKSCLDEKCATLRFLSSNFKQ